MNSARYSSSACSNPNSWYRETAQRLLVERNNLSAVLPLRKVCSKPIPTRSARIHALLDARWHAPSRRARPDQNRGWPTPIRAFARKSTAIVGDDSLLTPIAATCSMRSSSWPTTRSPMSASSSHLTVSGIGLPQSDATVAGVLKAGLAHKQYVRDAVITGLHGRELAFLQSIYRDPDWATNAIGRPELCESLARAIH